MPSQAAGSFHARGKRGQVLRVGAAPVGLERGVVGGWGISERAELLARGGGEGQREDADMRDHRVERHLLARGGQVELVVGDAGEYVGSALAG